MSFKNIIGKTSNKSESLVNRFAMIIGTSIFITLFFIAAYNLYASIPIIKQYRVDKDFNHESLSRVIFQNFKKDVGQAEYADLANISRSLINNDLILYVNVIDKSSNKYMWSSLSGLIGTDAEIYNPWKNELFAHKYQGLQHQDIREIYNEEGEFVVAVGFLDNDTLISLINVLLKGDIILVVIFIIFGFASAFTLAKFVTKPIKNLVMGAEEFSKGNLRYRAVVTTHDEIGILAHAFNDMANKLDVLYSSLEQQVKDRTNELVSKNVQLESAYAELKEAQTMVIHSEKMKSLGQLVAGVAHELNNPINFIYGNLDHLRNYMNDLISIIDSYERIKDKLSSEDIELIDKIKEEVDYQFILEDLPPLIKSCKDGSERCKQIVLDLKNFSRLDEAVLKEINIHEGIESTLNILYNKFKNRANIHKEYGNLPMLSCYAGQLNQVFMNILDNAIQAVPDQGDVYVKTSFENNNIKVIIEDNGAGIDKDILSRIFDPFFTTKPVGEGTGLGLSISYKIIKTHNGTIDVESEKGKGTKFTIKIPVDWHKEAGIAGV